MEALANGLEGKNLLYVARDKELIGIIGIEDPVRPNMKKTLNRMRRYGIDEIVMLTGDSKPVAAEVARNMDIDSYHAEILPEDKSTYVNQLKQRGTVMMVGDGINDAPVLKRADVGIAMGGIGSDCAVESADVIIMNDNPYKVFEAIKISQKTMKIVKQNIIFAISVKVVFLALGTFGMMTMWGAIFADVGVTLLAILNSLRAMHSPLCK